MPVYLSSVLICVKYWIGKLVFENWKQLPVKDVRLTLSKFYHAFNKQFYRYYYQRGWKYIKI